MNDKANKSIGHGIATYNMLFLILLEWDFQSL